MDLYISNLTSTNISVEGDAGVPKLFISAVPGGSPVIVESGSVVGNSLLCSSLASLITAGDISVNVGSVGGTTVTASAMSSYSDGTIFDTNSDGILDHAALTNNPHNTTKTHVGLANVTNDAQLKRAAADIDSFGAKTPPVAADIFLIEDSAAAFAKAKMTVGVLDTYIDAVKVADGTVNAYADKAVPANADVIMIEDSAAAFAKKKLTIQNLNAFLAPSTERVHIAGLDIHTLGAEASAALTGLAAWEFSPLYAVVQMETVVAPAATGDFAISLGITTPGGVEILAATICTGTIALNDKFLINLAGHFAPIPGNSTVYATVTTADTSAGVGSLADIYLVGETFISGT